MKELTPYNPVDYLDTYCAIEAFLQDALATNDPLYIKLAKEVVHEAKINPTRLPASIFPILVYSKWFSFKSISQPL